MARRPKVLISAFACVRGQGSEPGVGWNAAREMATHHVTWVKYWAPNLASCHPKRLSRIITAGTVRALSAVGLERQHVARLQSPAEGRPDGLHFVAMGRLLHWKGFHHVRTCAAADVPHAEYWVVGSRETFGWERKGNLLRVLPWRAPGGSKR